MTLRKTMFSLAIFTFLLCLGVVGYYYFSAERPSQCKTVRFEGSLQLDLTYREHNQLRGINCVAVDGVRKFVFRNVNQTDTITVHLPPLAIYYAADINIFYKLDKSQWPEFASKHASWILPPGGQRVFESSYNFNFAASANGDRLGTGAPAMLFVFGPSCGPDGKQEKCFTGCVAGRGELKGGQGRVIKISNNRGGKSVRQ